jgi:Bax protein|tara:strand:+ start:328 stop:1476 length:1149 start_codon:yes stop_codon:yes gene_type:complete
MDDLNFKNFKKLSFKNLSKIKFKNINRKKKTIENLYIMSPYVLGTIGRTIVSSIFIILFFYFAPIFLNFTNEKIFISGEFKNNSRKILTYELTGQKSPEVENEKINEKDLLSDILRLNDLETDTVRLSASTIQQLFKDTNYNLADIRKNKLVRPVALTWLPKEIRMIESTKKRKDLFIQIVLPLILQENNNIKLDRLKLFSIIKKSNNSALEKKWLSKKYKQYGVVSKDITTLKIRMDEVPTSLAIAQAAKETGWGTSRFALDGNALFGQWTWSGEGLKPKESEKSKGHKVMKFNVLQASVRAYQRNLNTHKSYQEFRKARAELREKNIPLDSILLSEYLDKYAETGKQYVDILQQIIKQNNLKDFDDAKLLPSSKKFESLI